MHELPYSDRAFHLVISGWAIAYSNRPERAMQEMIRVCQKPGLIAVGVTYEPPRSPDAPPPAYTAAIQGNNFSSAADIVGLIGPYLDKIILQHEPYDKRVPGPVMVIAQIKDVP